MKQQLIDIITKKGPIATSAIAREMGKEITQIASVLARLERQGVVVSEVVPNAHKGTGRRSVREYRLHETQRP